MENIGLTRVAIVSLCVSVLNWFSPSGKLSPEQVGDYYADLVLSMLTAQASRRNVVQSPIVSNASHR